jgi:hypothetical protein
MSKVHKFAFTAALAVAFALTFNACGSDGDSGGGGVEGGVLKGSVWEQTSKSSTWDFTYTVKFTTSSDFTYNQKGWGMVGTKKENYNETIDYTYVYYPEIREGIADGIRVFSISEDFKKLTFNGKVYDRK